MWIMVAGPYRSGVRTPDEAAENLEALNRVAYEVFRLGHLPVIGVNLALPVISAAGESVYDQVMMPMSLALAERCDAIFRVGGPSAGADREVERFRARGLPVFHSLDDIRSHVLQAAEASGESAIVDHVALLVASLEEALSGLAPLPGPVGPIQAFPGEGTRECYIGAPDATGRLLLIEAAGEGPYARAFRSRGPGLHHVALAVRELDSYVAGLAGSGWYLLPQSLRTIRDADTAWLARPGVPVLLEVSADPAWEHRRAAKRVVSDIQLPSGAARPGILTALEATGLSAAPGADFVLTLPDRSIGPGDLRAVLR